MPKFLYTLAIFLSFSCQAPMQKATPVSHPSVIAITSVVPDGDLLDTLFLTAVEVDSLRVANPEFFQPVFPEPDIGFYHSKGSHSEVDQDHYCLLYGYFLREQNGAKKLAERRAQLVRTMRAINKLEAKKVEGGTYFGHMFSRIEAYSEYELQQPWPEKPFSRKQKDSFIRMLKQSLKDEKLELDTHQLRVSNLYIKEIDSLITTSFSLEKAIKFHRERYQF